MMRNHSAHATAILVALLLATACTKNSPSAPSTPGAATKANVGITSVSVTAEALSTGGYTYRVTVKMRESGGVAATLSALDLTFMRDATTLASSHIDRPISDASNVVAANATVDSREIATTDDDLTHAVANKVVAKITFADGAASTSSATASADIATPASAHFTLSGTVSDESNARPIAGGTVQVLNGPDAGKSTSTDGGGAYSLSGLTGGALTVRASASGYSAREQGVTVARDSTLDLQLRPATPAPSPTPPPCSYTVSPAESGSDYRGASLTATISRTSGTCAWQASSNVSWITVSNGSGNGNATLSYTIAPNPTFDSRFGNVTVSWTGGSAQIRVTQGHPPDFECSLNVSKGPQDFNNVPSAGGQLSVSTMITSIPSGASQCGTGTTVSSNVPWITGGGSAVGSNPGAFTFTVGANPSPGTARNGQITATGGGKTASVTVTQR
jgi:carboxypeptidase family protein/all-beta uncharacterized protein